jgi:ABC-type phosphate/phosphonate transport system substrate-binding protein
MTRRTAFSLLAGMSLRGVTSRLMADSPALAGTARFRVVASLSLVSEVNMNDARAAIKSWAVEIAKLAGMELDPEAQPLLTPERLLEAVRKGELDAFASTTPEYLKVAAYTDPHSLWVDRSYVDTGEEYQILSHGQSALRAVADLRGHELLFYSNPTTCLASSWLEGLLDGPGLGAPDTFFKQILPVAKLSRAVLPVYFRQSTACLVTRRGFATMCEMNPDLARKLRVVATSPKLVPICMAFHKNCPPDLKARFTTALTKLQTTPGGKQILALFQSSGVTPVESAILRSSEEILHTSERLRATRLGR